MRHCFELPDLPALAFRKALGKNRPATLEGGGKGGGAPSPPDPYAVAGATTQTNEQTAQFNKALNLNNYSNPFGSQSSQVVGQDPSTGAPIYQTSISASAPLQNLINQSLGGAGQSTSQVNNALFGLGNVNSALSGVNASIDPNAAQAAGQTGQNAAYAAQTQYLDPRFSQEQTSLESQLANQGLVPGSQAYDNAMKNFNLSKNQAYSDAANQSVLTGQQIGSQMLQNELATAGQKANILGQQGATYGQQASIAQLPYSQLASLAALVPGNAGTAQSAAQPANIAQAFQNQYQGELNQYNASVGSSNSMMGGLFGLGSAGMLAYSMSDRRTKIDIEPLGATTKDGLPLYRFRYHWDAPHVRHVGVMADEARMVRPDAVAIHPSGYDMVDYSRI